MYLIKYSDPINMQIETRYRETHSGGGSLMVIETLEVPPMSSVMTKAQPVENRWRENLNGHSIFVQSHPAASARSGLMTPNSMLLVSNGKADILLTNCTSNTLIVPKELVLLISNRSMKKSSSC